MNTNSLAEGSPKYGLEVNVVIPVYNVASYLEQSVRSALDLREVGEVVLIEDGSTDNSLPVCHELAQNYSRVKVFTHPKGMNLGAGASRNLEIQNASFPYISFLDSDDFFCQTGLNTPETYFEKFNFLQGSTQNEFQFTRG